LFQSVYNYCIHAGWQKWMPTHRVGAITSVDHDNDTCDIDLDPVTNADTGQSVNQSSTLSDVPIEYMECDSEVFEEDDRVVVEFQDQDWDDPVVIGYESEPQKCRFEPFMDGPGQEVVGEGWPFTPGATLELKRDWAVRIDAEKPNTTYIRTITGNKLKVVIPQDSGTGPAIWWYHWMFGESYIVARYYPEVQDPETLTVVPIEADNELIIKLKCETAYTEGDAIANASLPIEDVFFPSACYVRMDINDALGNFVGPLYRRFRVDIPETEVLTMPFSTLEGWKDSLEGQVLRSLGFYFLQGYPRQVIDFEVDYVGFKNSI